MNNTGDTIYCKSDMLAALAEENRLVAEGKEEQAEAVRKAILKAVMWGIPIN